MTYDDAIAALATAKASGDVAAIIAAAEALAVTAAAPKPKATRKPRAPKDDRPAWFTAVAKTRRGVAKIKHSLAVTFADGQSVRVNAWQAEAGKPIAVGHALAVAIEFIRQRRGSDAGFRAPVAAIESAQLVAGPNDEESFDGAECSRLTEAMRARIEPDARPVDTLEGFMARREWLAGEIARREAALARVQAGSEPERDSPEKRWAEALAGSVAGGRRELAALDARISAMGGAVAQSAGEPCEAMETVAPPVVQEPEDETDNRPVAQWEGASATVRCLSHRGRSRLLAAVPADMRRVLFDGSVYGTFEIPVCEAWRVAAVTGLRVAGLPRKPRGKVRAANSAPTDVQIPSDAEAPPAVTTTAPCRETKAPRSVYDYVGEWLDFLRSRVGADWTLHTRITAKVRERYPNPIRRSLYNALEVEFLAMKAAMGIPMTEAGGVGEPQERRETVEAGVVPTPAKTPPCTLPVPSCRGMGNGDGPVAKSAGEARSAAPSRRRTPARPGSIGGEPCRAIGTTKGGEAQSGAGARKAGGSAAPARNADQRRQSLVAGRFLRPSRFHEPVGIRARDRVAAIAIEAVRKSDAAGLAKRKRRRVTGGEHHAFRIEIAHGCALYQRWPPWIDPPVRASRGGVAVADERSEGLSHEAGSAGQLRC